MKHSIHLSMDEERALKRVLRGRPGTNLSRIAGQAIRAEDANLARKAAFLRLVKAHGVDISDEDRAWAAQRLDEDDGP